MTEPGAAVATALAAATDRSSGSDELAALATPGWDQYHLGGAGPNVFRPLGVGPDDRVLILGAGSGVVARFAADTGADVVALERDPGMLTLARARCEGCERVQLHDEIPPSGEPFDVVLMAASPEWSPLPELDEVLGYAFEQLAPSGVVALAVPNAVSIAQLAGFQLPELAGVSTGADLTELGSAFSSAGMGATTTLACYPDVFGATALLSEAAFGRTDASSLVDQLVGAPVSGALGRPFVLADDRAVLTALVEAGAGLATAPGFMVVGARERGALADRMDDDVVAWRFTGGRRQVFQQQLAVRTGAGGLLAERQLTYPDATEFTSGWLSHTIAPNQPYVVGYNLEQRLLDAMAAGDTVAMAAVLATWRDQLEAVTADRTDSAPHPFLPADAAQVLPPDHLDTGLDNFVEAAGGPVFIDREWRATGGVDFDLAATRALWKVAVSTVRNGSRHPWAAAATVAEVWSELAALAGLDLGVADLERWWIAEGELLLVVTGAEPASVADELRAVATRSRVDRATYSAGVEAQAAVHELDDQVARLSGQLGQAHARLADLEVEHAAMAARLEELRSLLPVRAARSAKRLLGR